MLSVSHNQQVVLKHTIPWAIVELYVDEKKFREATMLALSCGEVSIAISSKPKLTVLIFSHLDRRHSIRKSVPS